MQITTIGLDIAKNVFQVHGIDAKEKVVARKQLRRSQVITFFKALPPCLIGMEACATAHYWARELTKLGHEVRLMPAKDVKAYVKRNKNDAADAEAICEAVRRPTMRFVRIKSAEQQGQLMPQGASGSGSGATRSHKGVYFFLRFLPGAVFSMAKSSNFFPSLIAATSHRGLAPRPAQVLPALSRYFGGTFFPLSDPPRPLLDAISPPNLASWLRSTTVLRLSSFPTSSRNCKSCSTDIEPRFVLAIMAPPTKRAPYNISGNTTRGVGI